ncbi:MAG: beta-1,6-N-acetylglucosaminyltransferase [Verrucomicrobiota bacterium]
MAFAYHILGHKNPGQIARLIRILQHEDDIFVLHFDRRAPRALHQLGEELSRAHRNVVVQRSRAVVWGGPAISDLQIEGMALALKHSATWSHFINLTGQDFPICPRGARLERLSRQKDASYLSWFAPLETDHWKNARARLERWHLHGSVLQRVLGLPGFGRRLKSALGWQNSIPFVHGYRRRWPDFFRYFGGSNYVVLSRPAAEYISGDSYANRIRTWLQRAAHPDEIVFQSILQNSPLAATLVNKDWREIDFPPHSPHPRTFGQKDFNRLIASENLFARKFDEMTDSDILDMMEKHSESK